MKKTILLLTLLGLPILGFAQNQPAKPTKPSTTNASKPTTSTSSKPTSKPSSSSTSTARSSGTNGKPSTSTKPTSSTGKPTASSNAKPSTASKPTTTAKPSTALPKPRPVTVKTIDEKGTWLVIGSNVQVRIAADANSAVIGKLPFGVKVEQKGRSDKKVKVAGAEDYWYNIIYAPNKTGWIHGAFLKAIPSDKATEAYTQVMRPRMRAAAKSFSEELEFYNFLVMAGKEADSPTANAEFGLARMVVIKRMLKLIPREKRETEPFKTWLSTHRSELVYSEPTDAYYLRFDLLWDLESKYRDVPFAERIGYEAAITELAGECEGYLACVIARLNLREGRYMDRYPNGVYANEMLNKIDAIVGQIASNLPSYKVPENDVQELNKELSTLRHAIEKTEKSQKETVLDKITQIEDRFLR